MSEELLPDVPDAHKNVAKKYNLTIIFCGMAAGKISAKVGGYYADTGNKFWEVLDGIGFTKKIKSCNYKKILDDHIGLTDLVKNQSGVDSEIIVKEKDIEKYINELKKKLKKWNPKILAFNGKEPAKIFLNKNQLSWGKQNKKQIDSPEIWVLPSTSRLNTWGKIKNHEKIWERLYQEIKQ